MAIQPETRFKNLVTKKLKEIPDLYYFIKEAKALRGIPDVIGCYKGLFFGWELKKSKAEAQKNTGRIVLQRYILSLIQRSGGIGEIVHPDNLDEKLRQLLEHDPKRKDQLP